jgi:hypothetical protein
MGRAKSFLAALALVASGCTAVNDFGQFTFDDQGVDGGPPMDGAPHDDAATDGDAAVDAEVPPEDADIPPGLCEADQRVEAGACVACPANSTNEAGDDPDGADTACDCDPGHEGDGATACTAITCGADQRVQDNACVACPANSTNEAGDDASGADTACDCDAGYGGDGITECVAGACNADERVQDNACVDCPANASNAPGDDSTGADTACDCDPGYEGDGVSACTAIICGANERVESNACVDCPANSTNGAGDDASGADTACACDDGYAGDGATACDPVCGDGTVVSGEACDDGNMVTETACPYGQATCTGCSADCSTMLNLTGPVCGDGTVDSVGGESCDDGDALNNDCCSDTCGFLCDEREDNDATSMANPAPIDGSPVTGGIEPAGDVDYWEFTLSGPAAVRIETFSPFGGSCTASLDTIVSLRSTSGFIVSNDDKAAGDRCSLVDPIVDPEVRALPAGTYYVMVRGAPGATISRYELRIEVRPPLVCGNNVVDTEIGEVCDDGSNLGLNVGDCVACRGQVERSLTILVRGNTRGKLEGASGPAEFADTLCPSGYRAIFADGVSRVASVSPNEGDGQLNWTLYPFTAYYNEAGDHIWTTDAVPLLGVRDGVLRELSNSLGTSDNGVWTGLRADWTTVPAAEACSGWASDSDALTAPIGNSGRTGPGFLDVGILNECSLTRAIYCAEQP